MEREKLRTEREEMPSRCNNILPTVRRLVFDCTSGEGSLEELAIRLRLLYENSRKILVSAGPSSQDVKDDTRMCELKSKSGVKEFERLAAVAVAALSKWVSDAVKIWNAELRFQGVALT